MPVGRWAAFPVWESDWASKLSLWGACFSSQYPPQTQLREDVLSSEGLWAALPVQL